MNNGVRGLAAATLLLPAAASMPHAVDTGPSRPYWYSFSHRLINRR